MSRYSFAPRHALSTGRGGLFALTWPLITILLALGSMRGAVEGLSDPSTSAVAGLLFLMALPTTWLFTALDLGARTSVVLGVVTGLPLWFFVGGRLAATARSWGTWWRRYLVVVFVWAVLAIVILAVVASIGE